jgi:excisionase family DNA binding protein
LLPLLDPRRRNEMDDELLTADQVAARLKATPRFVRRLVAERRIAFVKVGRLVRFEESAVAAYIDGQRVVPIIRPRRRDYLSEVA